jgi:hypothetical protein
MLAAASLTAFLIRRRAVVQEMSAKLPPVRAC